MQKKFLTLDEVLALYDVEASVIDGLTESGDLKALRDRATWKFRFDEVDALLRSKGYFPQEDSGVSLEEVDTLDFGGPAAANVDYLELDEDALAEQPTTIVGGKSDESVFSFQPSDSLETTKPVKDAPPADDFMNFLSSLDDGDEPNPAAKPTTSDVQVMSDSAELTALPPVNTPSDAGSFGSSLADDVSLWDDEPVVAPKPKAAGEIARETDPDGIAFEDSETSISSGRESQPASTGESGISLDTGEPQVLSFGDSGISLDHGDSGISIDTGDTGISLADDDSSAVFASGDSGISLDAGESGLTLDTGESGISLDTADTGISLVPNDANLESGVLAGGDSGLALDTGDTGISLDSGDSGLSLDAGDSGLSLELMDSGLAMDAGDSGLSLEDAPTKRGRPALPTDEMGAKDDFELSDEFSLTDDELATTNATRPDAGSGNLAPTADLLAFGENETVDEGAATVVKKGRGAGKKSAGLSGAFATEDVEDLELTDDLDQVEPEEFDELSSDEEEFSDYDAEEDVVAADDEMFSEEMAATSAGKGKRLTPALPSFGAATTVALFAGSLFLVVNAWLAWEAMATMWTGAEPSGAAMPLVDSLAGLLG